jgi:hypothetical protein
VSAIKAATAGPMGGGGDLAYVSRRLGHGSVAVTAEVYPHLLEDPERLKGRRDRLDRLDGAAGIAAV